MVEIRRVDLKSAFKIGLLMGAVLGIVNVTILLLFLILVAKVPAYVFGPFMIIRLISSIFFAALQLGILATILGLVYNFVARLRGGLRVEIEHLEKRKNDDIDPQA